MIDPWTQSPTRLVEGSLQWKFCSKMFPSNECEKVLSWFSSSLGLWIDSNGTHPFLIRGMERLDLRERGESSITNRKDKRNLQVEVRDSKQFSFRLILVRILKPVNQ